MRVSVALACEGGATLTNSTTSSSVTRTMFSCSLMLALNTDSADSEAEKINLNYLAILKKKSYIFKLLAVVVCAYLANQCKPPCLKPAVLPTPPPWPADGGRSHPGTAWARQPSWTKGTPPCASDVSRPCGGQAFWLNLALGLSNWQYIWNKFIFNYI